MSGEARSKIGQPNIIGRSTAAANALDHAIKLRAFLIQVGQRLGLCHIDQLRLPMTDGRRPWQGRSFAPWRQPIGCRRRRSVFARGYRWTRASAQLARDGLCVQRRYGHSRQDSGSAKKCKFAHCRSPVSALLERCYPTDRSLGLDIPSNTRNREMLRSPLILKRRFQYCPAKFGASSTSQDRDPAATAAMIPISTHVELTPRRAPASDYSL
jgi:hypothetical protein